MAFQLAQRRLMTKAFTRLLYKISDWSYDERVTVTISEFRKSLFQLVERAKNGETVEFSYHGETFTVVPKKRRSRLEGWAGLPSDPRIPGMTEEDWEEFRNERRAASARKFDDPS